MTEPIPEFTEARTMMIMDFPFFGALSLRLRYQEDYSLGNVGTATDGKNIFINPPVFCSWGRKDRITGIAHEAFHAFLGHITRKGNRDHVKWNCAGDYAINPLLKGAGLPLLETDLYNPAWEDKSADWIYSQLPDQDKQTGDGSAGQSGMPGNPNGKPCGGMKEPVPEDGETIQQMYANMEHDGKRAIAQAELMAKAQGKMPANLERLCNQILRPQVPWTKHLNHFAEVVTHNDYSWMRPNRRYMQQGFYIPTLYSESPGTFIVVVDTSCSVTQIELDQGGAEISGILTQVKPEKIIVLYCDTKVYEDKIEEFTINDLPVKLNAHGGGGTDFCPPFEWVKEQGINPKCLMYFTDMYGTFPDDPGYPVLWISSSRVKEAPFGKVIQIRPGEDIGRAA